MCVAGMGEACLYPPCATTFLSSPTPLLPFSSPVPSSLLFLSYLRGVGRVTAMLYR